MKTIELKQDIKYFDDMKSGKMNFNVRKNDRDFQVGDILELKAFKDGNYAKRNSGDGFGDDYHVMGSDLCFYTKEQADVIKVKITDIISPKDWWSMLNKFGINNGPVMTKSGFMFSPKEVFTVLENYFRTVRLPDGYVILGIEVIK